MLIINNDYFRLLFGDYYMGLNDEGWIDGSPITWSNFVDNSPGGTNGVLRISETFKWDWNDGKEELNSICERHPLPPLSTKDVLFIHRRND